MDTVELVIKVEETFGIDVPNVEAERFRFVGDIYDCVIEALHQHEQLVDEAETWETLRQLVVDQLGVRPEQVTRTADIIRDLGAD